MKGKDLLERLQDLFERKPELLDADFVVPIVDEAKRRERKNRTSFKTGLPYEKIRDITDGRGDKGTFLIAWTENELTHEPITS